MIYLDETTLLPCDWQAIDWSRTGCIRAIQDAAAYWMARVREREAERKARP